MSTCVVCRRPSTGLLCPSCQRSHTRLTQKDMTILGSMAWAASRARAAFKEELKAALSAHPLPDRAPSEAPSDAPPTGRRRSTVVLIPQGTRFAALRQVKYDGATTLPGGKVEEGETEEEAACREVWEETGLTLTGPLHYLGRFYHEHQGTQWACAGYTALPLDGVPLRSSPEGEAYWATREELLDGYFGPVVARLLAAYDAPDER